MNSAYKLYQGKEPEFTNYAKIKADNEFIDTLDYIFLSPHWKVDEVVELMTKKSAQEIGPMPTENEPSDHLLIGAKVRLA